MSYQARSRCLVPPPARIAGWSLGLSGVGDGRVGANGRLAAVGKARLQVGTRPALQGEPARIADGDEGAYAAEPVGVAGTRFVAVGVAQMDVPDVLAGLQD